MSKSSVKVGKGDITEVKSLANPPESVKTTLHAVFLLMGHPHAQCGDWKWHKKWLASSTFLEDINALDPKSCDPEAARRAKELLTPLSVEKVKNVSRAASSFFQWAQNVLAEVETGGGAGSQ